MVHRASNSSCNRPALVLIAALLAIPAVSQISTSPKPDLTYDQAWMKTIAAEMHYAKGYATVGYAPAIMTIPDHPFTAKRTYTEWARNGDPDKPIATITVTIARDNMGRIHYESSRRSGDVSVLISDPVEHLHYHYQITRAPTGAHVAERCIQPLMSQITRPYTPPKPTPASTSPIEAATPTLPSVPETPKPSKQELGPKEIEGTLAYGQQRINYLTLKTGLKTMLTEDWFSPELGVNLRELNDYSGQNKYTLETHDIELGYPYPNLFVLPAGYTLPGQTASCIPLPD